ncbi:MAG: glycosyltransferase [Saprospiraceae bacterium]
MTVFTCSIYPPVTWLWFQTLIRVVPDSWKILIYDASGLLEKKDYPGAEIVRMPNWEHGRKIDHALQHYPDDVFFVMDDDSFLFSREPLMQALQYLEARPDCILYSFHENSYQPMRIEGQSIPRMGTYSFLVHHERLKQLPPFSFRTRPHKENILEGDFPYWDTGSWLHYNLLKMGKQVHCAPQSDEHLITLFGTSSAYVSLWNAPRRTWRNFWKKLAPDPERIWMDSQHIGRNLSMMLSHQLYQECTGRTFLPISYSYDDLARQARLYTAGNEALEWFLNRNEETAQLIKKVILR